MGFYNPKKVLWKTKFPIKLNSFQIATLPFSYNIAHTHIIFVFVVVVYHNILTAGLQIIPLLVLFLFCLIIRFLDVSGQVQFS